MLRHRQGIDEGLKSLFDNRYQTLRFDRHIDNQLVYIFLQTNLNLWSGILMSQSKRIDELV